jgi:hypothetical protein
MDGAVLSAEVSCPPLPAAAAVGGERGACGGRDGEGREAAFGSPPTHRLIGRVDAQVLELPSWLVLDVRRTARHCRVGPARSGAEGGAGTRRWRADGARGARRPSRIAQRGAWEGRVGRTAPWWAPEQSGKDLGGREDRLGYFIYYSQELPYELLVCIDCGEALLLSPLCVISGHFPTSCWFV